MLSGWLASCSSDGPAISAEMWYRGFHTLDFQAVEALTCSARLSEVQLLLQQNSQTINQFNSHGFDISRVEFRTVDQKGESATVEAKGREIVFLDQETYSGEIKKNWQFVREFGVWKWCGDLPAEANTGLFSDVSPGVIVLGGLFVAVIFLRVILGNRNRDYSEFYTQSEDGALRQIQKYEAGWIKSFSKLKGYGFINDDRGKTYWIDYGSFIDQGYRDVTNGERVLFQAEWTARGPRARNVIRVESQTSSSNPHSRKLVILADRVKKLHQDFRLYKVAYLQKELNTCKSFFELLDLDVKRYGIKLADYEVVLLYEVEKDLHELSDEVQAMSYDSRWWARILHLILQTLNAVADIIQTASPQAAELLRSLGRGAGRLLDTRKPPLLGPGKK